MMQIITTESETKIDLSKKRKRLTWWPPTHCARAHQDASSSSRLGSYVQMPSFQYFQIFYEQTIPIFYGITLPNSLALKPSNFMGIEKRRSDRMEKVKIRQSYEKKLANLMARSGYTAQG